MIDNPKRYDAWNSTGICKECRREPYCKKMCKAADKRLRNAVTDLFEQKMVEKFGFSLSALMPYD